MGRAPEAGGVAMRGVGATRVMARGRDHRGLIRDRGRVVPGECGVAGAWAGSRVRLSERARGPGAGPRPLGREIATNESVGG